MWQAQSCLTSSTCWRRPTRPELAQEWDSVGLVCGDPADDVDSVTIAVDATAAVVDEVPDRGLLLAHHPLLLRGVDTVAASTAKGALLHRMIRGGQALFTAHTNADAASPGVSDALAEALGLSVEEVLAPAVGGPDMDKWVVYVPAENADAVREAMFAAGAGHIGDYSHCSWGVTGTGQFLPQAGASPTIGSRRIRRTCCRGSRGDRRTRPAARSCRRGNADRAPVRGAGLRHLRAGARSRRRRAGSDRHSADTPQTLAAFVSRVHDALPGTSWGIRASGEDDAEVSRVAVCGGAGDSLLDIVAGAGVDAYVTADLRHHPADEHRRRSDVALIDVAHWASEFPVVQSGGRAAPRPLR